MNGLYDKLIEYSREDYYPMHMPGHKRNTGLMRLENPYAVDITEIEGFDNLHQPEGILKELSQRLSRLYGADKSYPLVNGSTAGILAGISAAVRRGDKVLLARNSHKSVYHAVILMGLKPVYCYPQGMDGMSPLGGILPGEIEETLTAHGDIRLVIITSPTYEGVVSDIKAIADITHRHGALLLVDEAHGAHFGFYAGFPRSAVKQGADLVVQSLHKTLPAFTQTAVLHSNAAKLNRRIEQYLAVYQSSSPSYLLMAGMDRCIHMLEDNADALFEAYYERLDKFNRSMKVLKHLKLMGQDIVGQFAVYALDPSKIIVSAKGTRLSGHRLLELLREKYHIVMEMEAPDYVIGMTSICDTREGFERLGKALLEIDRDIWAGFICNHSGRLEDGLPCPYENNVQPQIAMLPGEAWDKPTDQIIFCRGSGRISAAFISLFPPGIPILVPGEIIDDKLISYISRVKQEGITIAGLTGGHKDRIEVVCDKLDFKHDLL